MFSTFNLAGHVARRGLVGLVVLALMFGAVVAFSGVSPVDGLSPGTAEAASCPPTVSRGSAGQWVRELQWALNQYPYYVSGPYLDVDGDFGPKTQQGVRLFQEFFGLQVDGIVGPQTWGTLGYCY